MESGDNAMSNVRYSKITIRQPQPLKAKVEQAAALRGMTVTSFINGTLELAADKTISRIRARELTERDSAALLTMLKKCSHCADSRVGPKQRS